MRFQILSHVMSAALVLNMTSAMLSGCVHQEVYDADYEVPKEFLLGPEDVLEIAVWRNQDLSRATAIRPDGLISMSIVGDIQAAGLTANALAERIAERLAKFVTNPAVSVSVKEINSYSVFVLGEVMKPGKYQLKSYTTLLQAISLAGGFTEFAKRNKLQVVRNGSNGDGRLHEIRIPVNYSDLLSGHSGNFVLKPGDTVVVP
jgi:polysaccharide export outer membrane protein